jgi:hypothetical protein
MEWTKEANGVHYTEGFLIEETHNPHEPYALYKRDPFAGKPSVYAECVGTLEHCQEVAHVMATGEYPQKPQPPVNE